MSPRDERSAEAFSRPAPAGVTLAEPALAVTSNRKNMQLLIQLRWIAVFGQVATIAFVSGWLGVPLPLAPMFALLVLLVLFNLASQVAIRSRAEISDRSLLIALLIDVAAFTGQLYFSGGATNPFIVLYLLQVTLGAVLLGTRPTWLLVALSSAGFALLAFAYRPLVLPRHGVTDPVDLYVAGAFIGFVLNVVLLVLFISRINQNLRERDAHLGAMRQRAAEEAHIVRMGLLASGAAHELGTPLASLSVIVNDWRRMPVFAGNRDLAVDLAEMETALQRCKTIVTGILVSAGEARGIDSAPTTVDTFLTELVETWSSARCTGALVLDNRFGEDLDIVSDVTLEQAVFNVLDNAFEVSPRRIRLTAEREGDMLVLRVSDEGPGFAPEMLAQLGRPYQSSKGRPGGGLGLFLVVNVVRKLGGQVTAENRAEGGATVTLTLPLGILAIGGDRDG